MYNKLLEASMKPNDWVLLIFCMLGSSAWLQIEASGSIGNRQNSSWYETHFLVERKGIYKLIYFKPRHFGRYTLYEVVCFFASFVSVLVHIALGIVWGLGLIEEIVAALACGSFLALLMVSAALIVIVNYIGANKDEKKKFYNETGERLPEHDAITIQQNALTLIDTGNKLVDSTVQQRIRNAYTNNTYYTIYNLWGSYWTRISKAGKDEQKIEEINLQYIEYFKNIEKLVVIKENKDGSLQLKISE